MSDPKKMPKHLSAEEVDWWKIARSTGDTGDPPANPYGIFPGVTIALLQTIFELRGGLHEVVESCQTDSDNCSICLQDLYSHASGCPIPYARKLLDTEGKG